MAPLLSQWLYEFIDFRKQIPNEVAIDRFESYFSNPKKRMFNAHKITVSFGGETLFDEISFRLGKRRSGWTYW